MKVDFTKLLEHPIIGLVMRALNESSGSYSLLVGGAVRDFVATGKMPLDIDLATNLPVEEIIRIFGNLGGTVLTHATNYGTGKVFLHGHEISATTFRVDKQTFGRGAVVCASGEIGIMEDAKRRDFTINALYIDKFGRLYDFFNGINDLQNKKIVFIGNPKERIKEDYLRILRFFRFSAKICNKVVLTKELKAIFCHLLDGLNLLSNERVTKELALMLCASGGISAFEEMQKIGILHQLFGCDFSKSFSLAHPDEEETALLSLFLHTFSQNFNKIKSRLAITRKSLRLIELIPRYRYIAFIKILTTEARVDIALKKDSVLPFIKLNPFCKKELNHFIQNIPPLPISTEELINIGLQKQAIGNAKKVLMEQWVKNNFTISKKALFSFL